MCTLTLIIVYRSLMCNVDIDLKRAYNRHTIIHGTTCHEDLGFHSFGRQRVRLD